MRDLDMCSLTASKNRFSSGHTCKVVKVGPHFVKSIENNVIEIPVEGIISVSGLCI